MSLDIMNLGMALLIFSDPCVLSSDSSRHGQNNPNAMRYHNSESILCKFVNRAMV